MAESNTPLSRELYFSRDRTFHGFVHMSAWFAIHIIIILAGLYFLGVQNLATFGIFLIAAGVVALGYGAATTPRAVAKASEKQPKENRPRS
ncbi:hypothetical protein [Pelagibius sp. 7325]|uniref:aa3-type cytochrome c oxidase subunit IV n=1 Tax=Pelagibius sp. 7325 TaxID=3131994 RepID=UPI0030ECF073